MSIDALTTAVMISSPTRDDQAFIVGLDFNLDNDHGSVISATFTATAHGVYEATIDQTPVGPEILSPGWTSFQWRLEVQEWDVTALLQSSKQPSPHQLRIHVGNGWWRGSFGFRKHRVNYGPDIGVIAALTIDYADGHQQRIVTGGEWRAYQSTTTFNTLYDGQHHDLRRGPGDPQPVRELPLDRETLTPQIAGGVIRHESLRPRKIWNSPSGKTLIDFGQNLVGWVRFTAPADPGREITLRHAEILSEGELCVEPLRSAKATDVIICGETEQVIDSSFTFHGFRYAEITGWPNTPTETDLAAVVIHSEMRPTGEFECSDPRVNQLHSNIRWGLRGNFLSIPTDCPQRDERLGWTGDIAAFAPTATFHYDVSDFLHTWLLNLRAELTVRDAVPVVVPDMDALLPEEERHTNRPTCLWADAAVWVPQTLWQRYGNRERLGEHFSAMVQHLRGVEGVLSESGLWDTGFQYGDWLDPDAPPNRPRLSKVDVGVVATACAYRSASFVAEAARELGHGAEADWAAALAERLCAAFRQHYVSEQGARIHSDAPTGYALALCFGLLEGAERERAGARLAELVRAAGFRIATGFAGTPFVTWALTDTGFVEEAYALLLQDECPSWLYPIRCGATTIWERWDALKPDGTVNSSGMTSFNHYALGAVGDWIYQVVGGIRPTQPGYAEIEIRPVPGPGITWARTALLTPRGRVECHWEVEGDQFTATVTVPDVPAVFVAPTGETTQLTAGNHVMRSQIDTYS